MTQLPLVGAQAPPEGRDPLDRDYTPDNLAARLASLLPWDRTIQRVLEPGAGGGAWLRAIPQHLSRSVTALDIDPGCASVQTGKAECADFMAWSQSMQHSLYYPGMWRYDRVIGNPPYSAALEHVERSLAISRQVAFLLRLAFLASGERAPFWDAHPCRKVWALSHRPSFRGGPVGQYDYAFFWWDQSYEGPTELEVLT